MAKILYKVMDRGEGRILIVDDDPQLLTLLGDQLSDQGYRVIKASTGKDALEKVKDGTIDIVLTDAMMPEMDGYELCRRIKEDEATSFIPVIMITALNGIEDKIKGIELGADEFLTKPFRRLELLARVKSLLRVKGANEELERVQNVLYSLVAALEANDPYTSGHSKRVSELSAKVARYIKLSHTEERVIRDASLLHDIGKIGAGIYIVRKPGALTMEEYSIIKEHPVIGERICSPLKFAQPLLPIIKYHHERADGSGYPEGLMGDDIPIGARIVGIVDAYDAFTSRRPYRHKLSQEEAFAILREESEKGKWERDMVGVLYEALLNTLDAEEELVVEAKEDKRKDSTRL